MTSIDLMAMHDLQVRITWHGGVFSPSSLVDGGATNLMRCVDTDGAFELKVEMGSKQSKRVIHGD